MRQTVTGPKDLTIIIVPEGSILDERTGYWDDRSAIELVLPYFVRNAENSTHELRSAQCPAGAASETSEQCTEWSSSTALFAESVQRMLQAAAISTTYRSNAMADPISERNESPEAKYLRAILAAGITSFSRTGTGMYVQPLPDQLSQLEPLSGVPVDGPAPQASLFASAPAQLINQSQVNARLGISYALHSMAQMPDVMREPRAPGVQWPDNASTIGLY